ncbi:MAG: SDR family oxidoreductase [Calditrichaeota bacterium]|nr:SDR family oxidoreductase [Calditrichota bacterium]
MFQKETLKGKKILVTGGGSGLGLAMADRFAELGADVAICGRTESKLQAAVERLRSHGTRVEYFVCDVRDYDAVGRMFADIEDRMGRLNGLVNNAAGNFLSPSEDLSPNAFRAVIDIVLMGTFNCTQHFARRLIAEKSPGSILNIVTTYVHTGSAFVMPSAAAKAGVYAMTMSLAYEWAEYGIRVNAIAPGPFPTKGAWSRLMPDEKFEQFYLQRHPLHRYGEKSELANLAAFIMSDMAPYLTGECITIDGAERLQGGQFNFITQMMPRDKLKAIFRAMKEKARKGQ